MPGFLRQMRAVAMVMKMLMRSSYDFRYSPDLINTCETRSSGGNTCETPNTV